jgi:hypothetical protein
MVWDACLPLREKHHCHTVIFVALLWHPNKQNNSNNSAAPLTTFINNDQPTPSGYC